MLDEALILNMFKNCELDYTTEENYWDKIASCVKFKGEGWSIPPNNVVFDNGASKFVVIFKNWDWVVKIPFTSYQYDYYDDDEECNDDWEPELNYFHGASNSHNNWDYCRVELELYEKARDAGLADFFAETRLLGEVNGHPIYLQRKATIGLNDYYEKQNSGQFPKEIITEAEEVSSSSNVFMEFVAILAMIEERGKDVTIELLRFLHDNRIGDLHNSNIGRYEEKFVMIDYSGYHDS